MSTAIPDSGLPPDFYAQAAFLIFGMAVAIAIAVRAHIFDPLRIEGPTRLSLEEPPGLLFGIMLVGLFGWFLPQAYYVSAHPMPATAGGGHEPLPLRPQIILGAGAEIVGLLILLAGNLILRARGLRGLGLVPPRERPTLKPFVAGLVFVLPIIALVAILTDFALNRFGIEHPQKHEMLEALDSSHDRSLRNLIVISASIIAPLFEETLFRGHLQTLLLRLTRRPWAAVILASLAFASVHPWWSQPSIFVLALCLGYVYERTGNLWPAILIHAGFNTVSIVLTLYVSAP